MSSRGRRKCKSECVQERPPEGRGHPVREGYALCVVEKHPEDVPGIVLETRVWAARYALSKGMYRGQMEGIGVVNGGGRLVMPFKNSNQLRVTTTTIKANMSYHDLSLN